MIKDVFIFPNGMVAVTDENGEQIATLQGKWTERADEILNYSTSDTIFHDCRSTLIEKKQNLIDFLSLSISKILAYTAYQDVSKDEKIIEINKMAMECYMKIHTPSEDN